jgi:uncharacterized repeat protein (TIGR03803 family)
MALMKNFGFTRNVVLGIVASSFLLGVASAQTESVLYSFTDAEGDGDQPRAGVVFDAHGNLYGTTVGGGSEGRGVVFKLLPSGKKEIFYDFTGAKDGNTPWAGVILDAKGNLYGTTLYGSVSGCNFNIGCGTVFELSASGKEKLLYSFKGGADGGNPIGGLVLDNKGNIYGTTASGSAFAECENLTLRGTVFKITPSGKETVLHTFTGSTDGGCPSGALAFDSKGNLYGTTQFGGANNRGTVFKLAPGGGESILYDFPGAEDGNQPFGGIILDAKGNLYGTTTYGGAYGDGTVFEISPSGEEIFLYSFSGTDGSTPNGVLLLDKHGNLYGTAFDGGTTNHGNVFELTPPSTTSKTIYNFTGAADGDHPPAGLVFDSNGNLYGTTDSGGDVNACNFLGCGTVFKVVP